MKRSSPAGTAPGSSTPVAGRGRGVRPRSASSRDSGGDVRSPHVILYIDGASRGNPGPAGVGVYLRSREGTIEEELFRYIGETTNNVAEYEALLHGLRRALELTPQSVTIFSDSELLVKQISGEYRVKNPRLVRLHAQARHLLSSFSAVRLTHVDREENRRADALANRAIDGARPVRGGALSGSRSPEG